MLNEPHVLLVFVFFVFTIFGVNGDDQVEVECSRAKLRTLVTLQSLGKL